MTANNKGTRLRFTREDAGVVENALLVHATILRQALGREEARRPWTGNLERLEKLIAMAERFQYALEKGERE